MRSVQFAHALFICILCGTVCSSRAETIIVGGRVANVYKASEIKKRLGEQERLLRLKELNLPKEAEQIGKKSQLRASNNANRNKRESEDFFVCRCQIGANGFQAVNRYEPSTGTVMLEDAGTWDPISVALNNSMVPVEREDIDREIKVAATRECNGFFSTCHVNILFVRIPGKYARTPAFLSEPVRRPVFRIAVDYTGDKNTFVGDVFRGATWYLRFMKGVGK